MGIGDIWDIIIIVLLIIILAYEINLQLVPNEDVRGEELWCGGAKDLNSPHHGSHYPCCAIFINGLGKNIHKGEVGKILH